MRTRITTRIHIERLVLDGLDVPPADVDQLVAAMGDELRRLVLDTPPSWAAVDVPRGATPADIGRALGGALHGAAAGRAVR